jgi:hypothetical protein
MGSVLGLPDLRAGEVVGLAGLRAHQRETAKAREAILIKGL